MEVVTELVPLKFTIRTRSKCAFPSPSCRARSVCCHSCTPYAIQLSPSAEDAPVIHSEQSRRIWRRLVHDSQGLCHLQLDRSEGPAVQLVHTSPRSILSFSATSGHVYSTCIGRHENTAGIDTVPRLGRSPRSTFAPPL